LSKRVSGRKNKSSLNFNYVTIMPDNDPNIKFIHSIWTYLDPELQDALSLAYNQAVSDGLNDVKTRYVFAAVVRLRPEILTYFPEGVLPEPVEPEIKPSPAILQRSPDFSGCVYDSLSQLTKQSAPEKRLSIEDVFADIAKHGTGKVVEKLRKYGVTPAKVDEIVRQLGWQVVSR
jgi:hypothetical protein